MTALPAWNGWTRHFLLTIHLNFLNSQAIVYGYLVPIIFLLAFGSVFRAGSPPLLAADGPDRHHHDTGRRVFRTADSAGRRTRTGHLAAVPLVACPDSVAGLQHDAGASVDCRLLHPGSNCPGAGHLRHTFSQSSGSGRGGISLCDRRLSGHRLADCGAGGQCARGSGAWPMYFPPDDHDRRSRSAFGRPTGLGATPRRLYAGPLRGRGPATLL